MIDLVNNDEGSSSMAGPLSHGMVHVPEDLPRLGGLPVMQDEAQKVGRPGTL